MSEEQYLNLLRDILNYGDLTPSRDNNLTLSLTGKTLTFILKEGDKNIIPLITTRKVNFRLILTELLWFISGNTNSKTLANEYDNHIWDANGSKENLSRLGFGHRKEGDLGPVYGFQWRNWNGKDIDQLKNVIENIKKNPFSRRHVVSAWNPEQLPKMVLPPCHCMFHFLVRAENMKPKYLDCIVYQRSADVPVGLPFNIASYATLTHMIAKTCNLEARKLIHNIGDAHIYENQIKKVKIQIKRTPTLFPHIIFDKQNSIDDYKLSHFKLKDYDSYGVIKFPFNL